MPGAKQPERGILSPYRARYRLNIGPCQGLDLSEDPSTLSDAALVDAINCRVHDGIVVSRGGQTLTETGMNGCVLGLVDVDGVGTKAILAHNERSPAAGIDILDETRTPNYVRMQDRLDDHPNDANPGGNTYADTKPRYVYTWWDGFIVFQRATTGGLFKIILPEENLDLDEVQVEELFPLQVPGEGSAFKVGSLTVLPNPGAVRSPAPIYFGTMGGGVVGYVEGRLVRLLADATFSGRVIVFSYNNRLYAAGAQKVMFQANGWSVGGTPDSSTWTNITMPVAVTDFRPMCAAEGLGFGWLGGYDDDLSFPTNKGFILKINDSSGTPTLSSALNGYGGANDRLMSVDDFALRGDTLFASWRWETTGGSFFADTGEWNGTSLTSRYGAGENNAMIPRIVSTQDLLYICAWGDSSGVGIWTWNGSSSSQVTDLGSLFSDSESPFDMVLF